MKKRGIINRDLAGIIAGFGHTDKIVVCDCGLPIPEDAVVVDLALVQGIPSFLDVLKALEAEMVFEGAYLSKDIKEKNPKILDQMRKIIPGNIPFTYLKHTEFKEMTCQEGVIFVRTGEATPFANVLLTGGVSFLIP